MLPTTVLCGMCYIKYLFLFIFLLIKPIIAYTKLAHLSYSCFAHKKKEASRSRGFCSRRYSFFFIVSSFNGSSLSYPSWVWGFFLLSIMCTSCGSIVEEISFTPSKVSFFFFVFGGDKEIKICQDFLNRESI